MKKSLLLLAMLAATQQAYALSEPDKYGVWRVNDYPIQGAQNYNISLQDAVTLPGGGDRRFDLQFTIACKPGTPVVVTSDIDNSSTPGLIIDGKRYEDIQNLGDSFNTFWNSLRQAKTLKMITGNEELPLPITDLAKVLPPIDSASNVCVTKEKPEPEQPTPTKNEWGKYGSPSEGYHYFVYNRGDSFSIACQPNKPAAITANVGGYSNLGSAPYLSDFVFTVDGKVFIAHQALKEKKALDTLWNELRKAKELDVYPNGKGGRKYSFPTDQIADVLPAPGSAGFICLSEAEHNAAVLDDDLANIEPLKDGDVHLRKRINPYYRKTTWNKYLLDITSRSNRMVITDLKINRGSCTIDPKAKLPFRMGFGGKVTLSLLPEDCNPLEVTVTTLGGEQTLSFDQ
ncbi:hypothetical protein ACET7A_11010 [Aeromonas veronii]